MAYYEPMAQQGSTIELAKDDEAKVGEQLNRILASKAFRQADRLKRFLSFIVEETIAGRGERLKEFVVGVEVFGKPESFDPETTPSYAYRPRRLRAQLARYYREEAPDSELSIDLPKGGYSPVFRLIRGAPARRTVSPGLVSRNMVVVAPFADHSEQSNQAHFCEGLTQEIIHTLAGMGEIRVAAWSERDAAPAATGQSNAAVVAMGSVRKAAIRPGITMSLVEAVSGCYIWSRAIDRLLTDVFGVQQEAAQLVADEIKREWHGCAHSRNIRHPAENLAAYNLYVQGRYHLNQRTEEGLRKAVEFFEKALVENAQYAQAYSGLAGRLQPTGPLRRASAGGSLDEGGVQRGMGRAAGRELRRGAHLRLLTRNQRRIGIGWAPNGSFSEPSRSTRAIPRPTTGMQCPA